MKVNKKEFFNLIKKARKVVDKKSSLDILRHVKLSSRGGVLSVTATNLENTLVQEMECTSGDSFEVCIDNDFLYKVCKPENAKDVSNIEFRMIETDTETDTETQVSIVIDEIETQLVARNAEDFPEVLIGDKISSNDACWHSSNIKRAFRHIVSVICTDSTRPFLHQVLLTEDKIVSTDGHRMAICNSGMNVSEDMTLSHESVKILDSIISPKDVLSVCIDQYSDHYMLQSYSQNHWSWKLYTKKTNNDFPPYQQVLPKDNSFDTTIHIGTKKAQKVFNQIGKLKDSKQFGVTMLVNGSDDVKISRNSKPVFTTIMTADQIDRTPKPKTDSEIETKTDDTCQVSIDIDYLVDSVKNFPDDCMAIRINGPLEPIKVSCDDKVMVIMPIRV